MAMLGFEPATFRLAVECFNHSATIQISERCHMTACCHVTTKANKLVSWSKACLLSCDNVMKSEWYCQLSGSGSNTLNLCKLPGRFSYDLETRLCAPLPTPPALPSPPTCTLVTLLTLCLLLNPKRPSPQTSSLPPSKE